MRKFFLIAFFVLLWTSSASAGQCTRASSFATGTGSSDFPIVAGESTPCQPKAIFFFTSASQAGASVYAFSTGLCDISKVCGCDSAGQSDATKNGGNALQDAICLYHPTGSGTMTLDVDMSITSYDSDGFTVHPKQASAFNATVDWIYFGGSDIANSYLDTVTAAQALGAFSSTNAGFKASFAIWSMSHVVTLGTATGAVKVNFGFTNGIASFMHTAWADTTCTNNNGGTYVRQGSAPGGSDVMASLVGNGSCPNKGVISQDYLWDKFLSTGWQVNVPAQNLNVKVFVLLIQGGQWGVGSFPQVNATGQNSVTGAAFPANAIFEVHTMGSAQSAYQTTTLGAQFSFGASDTVNSVASGTSMDDAVAVGGHLCNTQVSSKLWSVPDPTNSCAVLSAGTLVSLDNNGFTYNTGTNASGERFGGYFTVGANIIPGTAPVINAGAKVGAGTVIY